ncbi:AbrB/MazE/SpoVT family DNA-binding domain-containing protein [Cardiobacterium valvarum]|uniref:SpoVT/AbrB-like protein n=1 Tax=Cardiobacterium valvarum F0432 TaxID=797473 RepID=G9ZG54_9GAMM|nr:AbrB/MazE/SpoVT family DNA-binding domain-containing protein [Cardiobacterium valvarum]EHM53410.1 SpoVT/AbrB-like protein [Cardiobacterium valvarum F0432]
MQVAKWGNSLAVRIPAAVAQALQLKEGDDIEILVADANTFAIRRTTDEDLAFLERIRRFRGRMPPDFVFDREEAHAR